MATGRHDSSLDLALTRFVQGNGHAAPQELPASGALPSLEELPELDLTSDGPLPLDLPAARTRPPEDYFDGPPSPVSLPDLARNEGRRTGTVWLEGDVLMCACPDCGAPMSIRVWLMIADCWNCRVSIELTEEQEREARRLLNQHQAEHQHKARSRTRPAGGAPVSGQPERTPTESTPRARRQGVLRDEERPVVLPREGPSPGRRQTRPSRQRSGRRSAAEKPVGVRARIRKLAAVGVVRLWVHDFFRNMPAWIVSLVFHLVLLTVMGLVMVGGCEKEPEMLLLFDATAERNYGSDTDAKLTTDQVEFDLPVPNEKLLENKTYREAVIAADQDARELRLNPNDPSPHLPSIGKVKQLIASANTVRRTFAARDPRVRVELIEREGGTTMTEAAVARALRWLAQNQNSDGGWGIHRHSDAAGTSLALLPFLGAGQTHQTGKYQNNVAMGLRWLIENQTKDGDLRAALKRDNAGMYAHGQGTIVLSEAYALTGDEYFRDPAQRAVDFIVKAQHAGGGWRYQPGRQAIRAWWGGN